MMAHSNQVDDNFPLDMEPAVESGAGSPHSMHPSMRRRPAD
jgi:hypothetical protein